MARRWLGVKAGGTWRWHLVSALASSPPVGVRERGEWEDTRVPRPRRTRHSTGWFVNSGLPCALLVAPLRDRATELGTLDRVPTAPRQSSEDLRGVFSVRGQ